MGIVGKRFGTMLIVNSAVLVLSGCPTPSDDDDNDSEASSSSGGFTSSGPDSGISEGSSTSIIPGSSSATQATSSDSLSSSVQSSSASPGSSSAAPASSQQSSSSASPGSSSAAPASSQQSSSSAAPSSSNTGTTSSSCSAASPEAYKQCGADGHVHWFDSCGVQGAIFQTCQANEMCVNASATAASCTAPTQADYYVSPTGNDSHLGTYAQPFKSLEKAFSMASAGKLILVRGGTYTPTVLTNSWGFRFTGRSGASGNLIKVWAYPGESPVLDCSGMTKNTDSIFCFWIEGSASYVHVKGFEVKDLPQPVNPATGRGSYNVGILVTGNNNLVEGMNVHHIGGSGINVSGTGNTLLNDDIHDCYDPNTYNGSGDPYPGGNADGIHVTIGNSTESMTTISGCRMWNNSDDGFDCFNTDGRIYMDHCWAWHNGYIPGTNTPAGDGAGIKLGQTTTSYNTVKRWVSNTVAVSNRTEGFTANNGRCGMNITNNTAYNNLEIQYTFGFNVPGVTLQNNIAFGSPLAYLPYATHDHNSWDSAVTLTSADFQSVDETQLARPRKADGSLPDMTFLHPAPGSDLVDAGVDLGHGMNIGAF